MGALVEVCVATAAAGCWYMPGGGTTTIRGPDWATWAS
jgi:hypothetical protein